MSVDCPPLSGNSTHHVLQPATATTTPRPAEGIRPATSHRLGFNRRHRSVAQRFPGIRGGIDWAAILAQASGSANEPNALSDNGQEQVRKPAQAVQQEPIPYSGSLTRWGRVRNAVRAVTATGAVANAGESSMSWRRERRDASGSSLPASRTAMSSGRIGVWWKGFNMPHRQRGLRADLQCAGWRRHRHPPDRRAATDPAYQRPAGSRPSSGQPPSPA